MTVKRILYIEDSVTSQLIFQRMFTPDCEVLIAASPRQAGEVLAKYPFDLVVTDFMFPQADAYGVISAVRQKHGPLAVPIIVVSGSMDQALKSRLLAAGANACVNKPLLNLAFRALVHQMLTQPQVEAQSAELVIACSFQWVQDGVCHEFCPEAGLHLTGLDRLQVSAQMLAKLHELWHQGTALGRITQERTHNYTLRRPDAALTPGSTEAPKPH